MQMEASTGDNFQIWNVLKANFEWYFIYNVTCHRDPLLLHWSTDELQLLMTEWNFTFTVYMKDGSKLGHNLQADVFTRTAAVGSMKCDYFRRKHLMHYKYSLAL